MSDETGKATQEPPVEVAVFRAEDIIPQQEETQAALDEKTERWVYLNELAEKIAEQG